MRADLYIYHDTFSYNGNDSSEEIKQKLLEFKELIEKIRDYKEDNVLHAVKEKLFNTIIDQEGITIKDFFENQTLIKSKYGLDILKIVLTVFKYCHNCIATLSDLEEYLELESESECNALLVLNKIPNIENGIQVIANVKGWLNFRRHFLIKYPKEKEYFISELTKYFPGLIINPNIGSVIDDVWHTHTRQIVIYLSILEENLFPDLKKFKGDFIQFLDWFARNYHFDGASFEGKKDKKFLCTFNNGNSFYCEPHLKMFKDDNGNKGQHCRIYFKAPDNGESSIYIGYICSHL